jgi:hypothetical protein
MLRNKTFNNRILVIFLWFCVLILISVGYFIESSLIYKVVNFILVLIIAAVILWNKYKGNYKSKVVPDTVDTDFSNNIEDENSCNDIENDISSNVNYSREEIIQLDNKESGESENIDKEFLGSVNDVVSLIKDFYPATNVAIYWYNESNKAFKILTSFSESANVFCERFNLNQDIISQSCKNRKSVLLNIDYDNDNKDNETLVSFYQTLDKIKSLICSPILLDNEVIGVILCDNEIESFFGIPNVDTLQIFSTIISYLVKYFSVNEEFSFDKYVLGVLTDKKLFTESELFELIHKCVNRFIDYKSMALVVNCNEKYIVKKTFNVDELSKKYIDVGSEVSENSIVGKSIISKQVLLNDYTLGGNLRNRFCSLENINLNNKFCSLPVMINEYCLGAIAFDYQTNNQTLQSVLGSLYKLINPLLVYLYLVYETEFGKDKILNQVSSKNNFEDLVSEIANESRLYSVLNNDRIICVTFCLLNEDEISSKNIETEIINNVFKNEILQQLNEYSSVYKIRNSRYSLVLRTCDLDSLIIHLEKIKRDIDSKVFLEDSKQINFNVGIVVYQIETVNFNGNSFADGLEKMLQLCISEGGTSIIVS